MLRRNFIGLMVGAALTAAGCSSNTNTTIQGIIDWLKANCQFATNAESIAQVIATIITGFNASAGVATVVVIGVATQVEQAICNAVKQQAAQMSDKLAAASSGLEMVVTVNGVRVPGTYTGK